MFSASIHLRDMSHHYRELTTIVILQVERQGVLKLSKFKEKQVD